MFSTRYQQCFNSFFATIDIKSGNNIDIPPNAIVVSFRPKGRNLIIKFNRYLTFVRYDKATGLTTISLLKVII